MYIYIYTTHSNNSVSVESPSRSVCVKQCICDHEFYLHNGSTTEGNMRHVTDLR